MVRRNMSLKNPVTPSGIDPGTVRLVAQCLNHYANPGPINVMGAQENIGIKLLVFAALKEY